MKIRSLIGICLGFVSVASAGDWGKAPVDKMPIVEECVDLGGSVGLGYHSDYIYKGYKFGFDAVSIDASYTFVSLVPLTLGVNYTNVVAGPAFSSIVIDALELSLRADLPSVAGIDVALSATHRSYPEELVATILWPSSNQELGLHLSRDLGPVVAKFDLFYNSQLPNSWNGTIPSPLVNDTGAWYWDFGLERSFDVLGHSLVLGGGVAYADNYWGAAPAFQTGGRSSGWNHYYLEAALPIELNCRATLTPYIGYVGAPEGWLLDGAPHWWTLSGQSDVLHGGVTMSVAF